MTLSGALNAAWDLCPLEVAILLRSRLAVVWKIHHEKAMRYGAKISKAGLVKAKARAARLIDEAAVDTLDKHGLLIMYESQRKQMLPYDTITIPGRLIPRIMVPDEDEEEP